MEYLILSVVVNIALVTSEMASRQTSNSCLTPGCIDAATSVLNNMDASVDPCDDFYTFACGNFIKRSILKKDQNVVSPWTLTKNLIEKQLREALEKGVTVMEPSPFTVLKRLYQSCMNTTAIKLDRYTTIKSILQELGGWPVLEGKKWSPKKFNWKDCVYKLRNMGYNFNYFISVEIKNYERKLSSLYIGRASVSRSNLNKMVRIATDLGARRKVAKEDFNKTLEFERSLDEISEKFRPISTVTMKVSELKHKVPNIPWLEYLNSVINVTNFTIKFSDVIEVKCTRYFSELEGLLNRTSKRIQANYLMWKVVEYSLPYITQEFNGFRWKECVKITLESMPIATGALYVRKYVNKDIKHAAMGMVSDFKKEFAGLVEEAGWLDFVTEKHAVEKIAAMSSYVAYPDEYLSDEKLEDFYQGLHVESDNFLKIRLSINRCDHDNDFKRLVLPVNQTEWLEYGSVVRDTMYYASGPTNFIKLPAGQLQALSFSADRPWYMNYGGMGFMVAHIIIHRLDNIGRRSISWSPSANATFIAKAQCMIDQYGNLTVPELELNVNGSQTLRENIADNGGVRIAYLAYNEWVRSNGKEPRLPYLNYTDRQLFWISFANTMCEKRKLKSAEDRIRFATHSPPKFRVNVPLGNTDYFARDFNCRVGSKMNPVEKCRVWRFN